MEQNRNEAIDYFKDRILKIGKPIKILQIGSNCVPNSQYNDFDYERDFDIIIIVKDTVDCYEYVKQLSPIIKDIIIEYEIEINAYPVKESIYQYGESEFLNNVRKNGIEI